MPSTRNLAHAALAGAAVACLTAPPAAAGTAAGTAAGSPPAGVNAAPGQGAEALTWRPCATTAKDWPTPEDSKSECALVTVPMDYAKPDGRKIRIAVSRLKAADAAKRRGVLVISPGGPGISNITAPSSYAANGLAPLATDHDLIGFDPRGVGYSDRIDCDEGTFEPPANASAKAQAKALFDHMAAANKRCTALDPAFARQLTTRNIARDVDAIRAALGVPKISFYGVSYGTAVGLNYRSLFDTRVERMWLDSVMPPVMDLAAMDAAVDAVAERNFDGFVTWLAGHDPEYHFGATPQQAREAVFALRDKLTRKPRPAGTGVRLDGAWVRSLLGLDATGWATAARDLATARDGGVPRSARPSSGTAPVYGFDDAPLGLNSTQYNGVFCNEGTGGRDFDRLWADVEARRRTYPATGGGIQFGSWCAGWPWPAQPWRPVRGASPLQVSGHVNEATTPYAWAMDTVKAAGGALLTVQDDAHASLAKLPCADKAVEFFRTGRTATGTCPGMQ
ncbi:alpha/beta fold hydrolase [Nonomuraea sp. NPDC004580]|uniref:alpha/beta fold hydrolase n=1 Tax=Nonomuraea sp. NPDC004580 TaxID=3154552 RepID=UPI0033B8EE94